MNLCVNSFDNKIPVNVFHFGFGDIPSFFIATVDAITHVYCYVENSVPTSGVGGGVQEHP